nr:hypothetical protein BaRGS_004093 [Batillaria attramentaria]
MPLPCLETENILQCLETENILQVLRVHVLSEHTLPNEQCQTCNFFIAWPEAVLPHVLWHIVKNVQENNTTGCSTDTVNVMDIQTLQLVKSKVREKLFCRLCGQMFVTAAFLQHHLKGHKFWNKTICCVCQRVDFHGRPQTESHQATCLMQWRVKHAVALKATGLLQLKAGRGGDGSTEEDEGPNTSCSTQEKSIKLGGSHQAGIPGNAVGTKRSLSSVLRLKGPPAKKAATSLLSNPSSSATPNANMRKTPPSRQSPPAANNHQSSLVLGHKKLCTRTAKSCDSAHASPSDDGSSDNETESEDNKFRKSHFPPFLQDHEAAEESVRLLYHPCHLCGLTYESKDTLMGHYASVHSGKKNVYFCMVCRKRGKEQSFSKMQLLVSHCVRKHRLSAQEAEGMAKNEAVQPKVQKTGEVYPMPVTTQPTGSPKPATPDTSPVKRLRVAGDVEQEFVCAKCIFSASNQEEFRSHITQHKVDNSVQCLECGLCFSVIPSLKKHLFMVHRIRQPQAYIKEHNITLQDLPNELVSHMNQFPPLGEQEFVININRAPVVNKEVPKSSKKELKVLIEETKRNASLLECTVCYREFEDEAQLKSHMRTHGMAFIRSRRTNARDSTGQREQPTEKEKNDPETICQT